MQSRQLQPRIETPSSFKPLFNQENLLRTLLVWGSYFLTLMVVYIMLSWLPSLFMELGFSRKEGSTAQFFFMVAATVGTIILGILTDRWKKAYVIVLMYGGIAAGLFSLNAAGSLQQIYWAAALTGAFVIGCQGVLYAFGSIVYPTNIRASGVGMASAVGRVEYAWASNCRSVAVCRFWCCWSHFCSYSLYYYFSNTHAVFSTLLACTDLNLII